MWISGWMFITPWALSIYKIDWLYIVKIIICQFAKPISSGGARIKFQGRKRWNKAFFRGWGSWRDSQKGHQFLFLFFLFCWSIPQLWEQTGEEEIHWGRGKSPPCCLWYCHCQVHSDDFSYTLSWLINPLGTTGLLTPYLIGSYHEMFTCVANYDKA